jgi:hypothetical protein
LRIFAPQMLLEKTISKEIDLGFVKIKYYEPDLVIYYYAPRINLTWPMLQEVAKETNELTGFRKCYMCSVIGESLTIEQEARVNGTNADIQQYTKAAAIVQNSLAHRILGNFVIKVQRPLAPTKLFTTVPDALTWLNKLKVQEQ